MSASLVPRPTDMPMMALTTAEMFVVMSLRLRFIALLHPQTHNCDWQEGLVRAGLGNGAIVGFGRLVRVIATASLHRLDIRWQCCSRLGADEAMLLHCLRLMQSRRMGEACAILHDWLCPCAVRAAVGLSETFAQGLVERSLVLDGGDDDSFPTAAELQAERAVRSLH